MFSRTFYTSTDCIHQNTELPIVDVECILNEKSWKTKTNGGNIFLA